MRYLSRTLAFLLVPAIALAAAPPAEFRAPAVQSLTDAYHPYMVLPDGFFLFGLELNRKGKITGIEKWRDPGGGMMAISMETVRAWKFAPASADSSAVDSILPVVFVYRPTDSLPNYTAPPPNFQDTIKPPDPDFAAKTGYEPAKIAAVSYPQYPATSASNAAVVIQLSLTASGDVQYEEVLQDAVRFTLLSMDALRSWKFEPAKFRGKPVVSKIVVAFIFQPAATSPI